MTSPNGSPAVNSGRHANRFPGPFAYFVLACERSTAVKRHGQFFAIFREILFTIKYKQDIHVTAVECKFILICLKQTGFLTFNTPHPDKMAATSLNFPCFQISQNFFSKVPNKLVNQQDTGKVSNVEQ